MVFSRKEGTILRKLSYLLGTLLLAIALIYGYFNNVESNKNNENEAMETAGNSISILEHEEISKGLDTVLASLQKLEKGIQDNPKNMKKVAKLGKAVEEKWDMIERKVEKLDKEAYVYIEEALYPLFAEVKKDKPNINTIIKLTTQSKERISSFQEKISKP